MGATHTRKRQPTHPTNQPPTCPPAPPGPKELLLKLVEDYYPLPKDPYDTDNEAGESR